MHTIKKVVVRLGRAVFVLSITIASVGVIACIHSSEVTQANIPVKLQGVAFDSVTSSVRPESLAGAQFQIVLPQTTNNELNKQITAYIDAVVADFKGRVAPNPVAGFYSQLRVIPRIDYVSGTAVSLALQIDEYQPNKEVKTSYKTWLGAASNVQTITLTSDYVSEIADATGLDKKSLSSLVGKPLQATFMPDYKLRIYQSTDYPSIVAGQKHYREVPLGRLLHIAAAYRSTFYVSYPSPLTLVQQKQLTKRHKLVLQKNTTATVNCAIQSCIALTFDDGPSPTVTPRVLDVLKRTATPATFFELGSQVEKYPDISRRIATEGHEIENHSYSHPDFVKLKRQNLMNKQIDDTQRALANVGIKAKFFRPPYGSVNDMVRKTVNMPIITWNIDAQEWRVGRDAKSVADSIVHQARPGAIILMHDTRAVTVDALDLIIEQLKDRGFVFVTVEKLLHLDPLAVGQYNSAP